MSRFEKRDIPSLAKYIQSLEGEQIVVCVGAGISTAAGIPDFRSPETGLYHNLAKLNLKNAEDVFDITYFRSNPKPFYELAHSLYPGQYSPTLTHVFIALLHKRSLLKRLFTQNIDTLDRLAGVPAEYITEAHGSFANNHCIDCRRSVDDIKSTVMDRKIPKCKRCGGIVKPDIVFFGESLPAEFFRRQKEVPKAKLVIVIGTSLTVYPFAMLPQLTRQGIPRVLINKELVGDFDEDQEDDLIFKGECDVLIRRLARALGWEEELDEMHAKVSRGIAKDKKDVDKSMETTVKDLVDSVEKGLHISEADNANTSKERDSTDKIPKL